MFGSSAGFSVPSSAGHKGDALRCLALRWGLCQVSPTCSLCVLGGFFLFLLPQYNPHGIFATWACPLAFGWVCICSCLDLKRTRAVKTREKPCGDSIRHAVLDGYDSGVVHGKMGKCWLLPDTGCWNFSLRRFIAASESFAIIIVVILWPTITFQVKKPGPGVAQVRRRTLQGRYKLWLSKIPILTILHTTINS